LKNSKNKKSLSKKIQSIFFHNPNVGFTPKQIFKKIQQDKLQKADVLNALQKLVNSKKISAKIGGKHYNLQNRRSSSDRSSSSVFEGRVDMTSSGAAYILVNDDLGDVYVQSGATNQAFDGDRVKVRIIKTRLNGKREGEIVEIIERRQEVFTGIISMNPNFAFFLPSNKGVSADFYIKLKNLNGAKQGDKVLAEILAWPQGQKSPYAHVVKVLGEPGEHDVEMEAILVENGFRLKFPRKVQQFVSDIPIEIPQEVIDERIDFRGVPTFTIDPHDAKDFDDALSIQELENGNWEVGVHIADITHYVEPNSPADKEALKRGTSVYLVDRVLPMFPERLSNIICSLRPDEDKLCFSAIFELNDKAEVIDKQFARTVIHSNRRFSYEEAQEVIETGKGDYQDEMLKLFELSEKIREKRENNGALRFDRPEVRFKLDEKNRPIEVILKVQKESNRMIEDFMLLANEAVATYFSNYVHNNKKAPGLYRTHDVPTDEKLEKFGKMASKFGHRLKSETPKAALKSLNGILKSVKGKPEQNLIQILAIRSMAKAEYTTKNIGHYGLTFEHYTHFTSPIRRYPDVMVHRLLQNMLDKKPYMDKDDLDEKAKQSSMMERAALRAERDSTKFKQVEYMSERLGEHFMGSISGVQSYGLFVECEDNYCEGLVRTESLVGDKYLFDEDTMSIIGFRTGKKYRLGDKIKIIVVATDLTNRTIDFELVENRDSDKKVETKDVEPKAKQEKKKDAEPKAKLEKKKDVEPKAKQEKKKGAEPKAKLEKKKGAEPKAKQEKTTDKKPSTRTRKTKPQTKKASVNRAKRKKTIKRKRR